ncbi:unnamed protein product [Eruca vesicaria subsp. sativa]|uniref:K-box domain-containing protein n=1 Tax=Eruca vesicaria subsp. sativa TaxID=29727 RepID=A0ABC8JW00_ERUVS|nr:unnamed protein product [Eruca vesicaria subsp. sativa]
MGVDELEQLELQVDTSLRQIRSLKTRSMRDQLSDLKTKEEMILETNRSSAIKILYESVKEWVSSGLHRAMWHCR